MKKPKPEGSKIYYEIDNAAQQEQLKDIMQDMLTYIRRELKNMALSIEFLVNIDESNRPPYTNREKFDAMAKKNSALLYLKEKFEGSV